MRSQRNLSPVYFPTISKNENNNSNNSPRKNAKNEESVQPENNNQEAVKISDENGIKVNMKDTKSEDQKTEGIMMLKSLSK